MSYYIDTEEGLAQAPDCFNPPLDNALQLDGMSWLRVLSACQALMSPSGAYRVTHKRCREVIQECIGFCPKGKPGTPAPESKRFRKGGKRAIYEWLGVQAIVHERRDAHAVDSVDQTYLIFKDCPLTALPRAAIMRA